MMKLNVFSGNSNAELAEAVCSRLGTQLGRAKVETGVDGECDVEILDTVRDGDVYVLQSGSGPVNDSLMELCIMIQACRLAASRRIVAVIPYFPYSKQSKKKSKRRGIPARLVADMLKVAGATQVVCLDLHSSQIQGFFDIPCDNLSCEPFLIKHIKENIEDYENAVILAKNAGAAKKAVSIANALKIGFAVMHRECQGEAIKRTMTSGDLENLDGTSMDINEEDDYGLVGNVKGKTVIILDDLVDSARSFVYAANVALRRGGLKVYAVVTHGFFSGQALAELQESRLHEIVVTNSIPQSENVKLCSKLRVVDVSPLLCEAIRRLHHGESLSFLRDNVPF